MKDTGNTAVDSCITRSMRMTRQMSRVLPVLLLLVGFSVTPALSQSNEKQEEAAEKTEKKTEIPKTLPGVWSAITDRQQELHKALAAKELKNVHLIAFAIRDYVSALPGKSNLPADKKKSLKASDTRVVSLAKLLDEAGDAGDSAKVASLVGKLDTELKSVEALYAAKDLKPPMSAAETSKLVYVCPMHPDVTSDKPGKCSKCGMTLVKKSH